jgi:exodeoxyribonuclease VII large subunit
LQRGYSIVRDSAGHIVRDAAQLSAGDRINLRLAHGEATATVETAQSGPNL